MVFFVDITSTFATRGEAGLTDGLKWLQNNIAHQKSRKDSGRVIGTGNEKLTGNYGVAIIEHFKHFWSPSPKSTRWNFFPYVGLWYKLDR